MISIHAPRVGSDIVAAAVFGERNEFQSTLPVWGATPHQSPQVHYTGISIHAPRVGSDFPAARQFNRRSISIHAPRVGSDGRRKAPPVPQADFNPRSPCGERQQRCTDFSFASSAKRVFFCDILQIGRHLQGIGRKRRGDFLSRSVRTSRGKYGCLAFAFRESGGLRENRRFYSQSVLFSFRIDCQGSRIAGCPFRGP